MKGSRSVQQIYDDRTTEIHHSGPPINNVQSNIRTLLTSKNDVELEAPKSPTFTKVSKTLGTPRPNCYVIQIYTSQDVRRTRIPPKTEPGSDPRSPQGQEICPKRTEHTRKRYLSLLNEAKRRRCPSCGCLGPHEAAVRSRTVKGVSLVDVGWCCRKCGNEWGFEVFH